MSETPPSGPASKRPVPRVRLFLESRYRKLVRGLPQTIFYCPECRGHRRKRHACAKCEGRGKLTEDSVQELLGRELLPAYRAREGYFHGAGREDIDVRMLGRGRPFVYELEGVKNLEVDLVEVRRRLLERHGDRIQIDPLVPVPRARIAYWKEGRFPKLYRALIDADAAVAAERRDALVGKRFEIVQRTPKRVAHRRSDLERRREVGVLAVGAVGERSFHLDLRCEHGTYVKEWVSGDEGRTTPALPDLLGAACRCAELDVLEILTEEVASVRPAT